MTAEDSTIAAPTPKGARGEHLLAIRNALVMGSAMVVSWTIGFGVRLVLPRHLGPERFGALTFADGFTASFFILLSLGIDSYARREVPLRPHHGSDFIGGVLAVRFALSALVIPAMLITLHLGHRPASAGLLVILFGVAQFFVSMSGTLSALLQAGGSVRQMSAFNVISKLAWGGGIGIALWLGLGLWAIAAAFLLAEVIRFAALWNIARRFGRLELRFSLAGTKEAMIGSLPFFVFAAAQGVYTRLDVTFIEMLVNTKEVGWYGAATSFVALAGMGMPLLQWVLLPMLVRTRARSEEEFAEVIRGSLRFVLAFAVPLVLAIELGAPWLVNFLFGPEFAPAALPLRIVAPMWVAVYINIAISLALTADKRAWTVTNLSLLGMAITVILNLVLVPLGARLLGPGGGGAASALAALLTEATITTAMIRTLGARRAFDRRTLIELRAVVFTTVLVVALDWMLRGWNAPARLLVDGLAYLALATATGAFPVAEVVSTVRQAMRKEPAGAGE